VSLWERLLLTGGRGTTREEEGERTALNAAPLFSGCCVVRGEERRTEETLSEVTRGWMFIFRAVNYLTTALAVCVCACMCVYLRRSQGRCGPLSTPYHKVHREASECRQKSELKGWRISK